MKIDEKFLNYRDENKRGKPHNSRGFFIIDTKFGGSRVSVKPLAHPFVSRPAPIIIRRKQKEVSNGYQ